MLQSNVVDTGRYSYQQQVQKNYPVVSYQWNLLKRGSFQKRFTFLISLILQLKEIFPWKTVASKFWPRYLVQFFIIISQRQYNIAAETDSVMVEAATLSPTKSKVSSTSVMVGYYHPRRLDLVILSYKKGDPTTIINYCQPAFTLIQTLYEYKNNRQQTRENIGFLSTSGKAGISHRTMEENRPHFLI